MCVASSGNIWQGIFHTKDKLQALFYIVGRGLPPGPLELASLSPVAQ